MLCLYAKNLAIFTFYNYEFSDREFGVKVINVKVVLKQVPILLDNRDKNVREEGKKLVIELYRWIGQALKPQLSVLKPIQVYSYLYCGCISKGF